MDDKSIMENLLNCTKGTCDLYMHGAIEASTPNVRQAFATALNFELGMQDELYREMQRKGWNGKGQYIELAQCISYQTNSGEMVNSEHNDIGNKAIAFVGTSGVQIGWLASQADMLAEDWRFVK